MSGDCVKLHATDPEKIVYASCWLQDHLQECIHVAAVVSSMLKDVYDMGRATEQVKDRAGANGGGFTRSGRAVTANGSLPPTGTVHISGVQLCPIQLSAHTRTSMHAVCNDNTWCPAVVPCLVSFSLHLHISDSCLLGEPQPPPA